MVAAIKIISNSRPHYLGLRLKHLFVKHGLLLLEAHGRFIYGSIIAFLLGSFFLNPANADDVRVVKSLLEMRREQVVIQKWDLSCGAAALSTLLTYQLQNPTSEKSIAEQLIKRKEYIEHPELIQIKEGFSLLDLKRFVDKHGYEGIGMGKLELVDLDQYAPIMVPLKIKDYNHFVIFRGMLGNRVLIADPAWGNRTLLTSKFMESWIEYPNFGKVGFIVGQKNGIKLPNRMRAMPENFVFLR